MGGLKAIKRRLVSVKNTKKITYAMKLVSAAKLRRAQESVQNARAYTDALNELLAGLVRELGTSGFSHPLMQRRNEVKSVRYLVVGGSRGLSGSYNAALHRFVEVALKEKQSTLPNAKIDAYLIGKKPAEYFRRLNKPYSKSLETLSEDANLWPIEDISNDLEAAFRSEEVDEVYLIYTKFKSALSMKPVLEKLLPMETELIDQMQSSSGTGATLGAGGSAGVTLFEPSMTEVFAAAIPRILKTKIRQACLDAKASEHGSRMTAMDAASKNAGEIIDKLTLLRNKLRQSGITGELLDIVGGAEALK